MPITVPLVGMHFNPPAKQVLAILPSGKSLTLRAEPDNPYDPEAILVLVDWSEQLEVMDLAETDEALECQGAFDQSIEGSGFDREELRQDCSQFKLGHVGASGGKPCQKLGLPGTQEVHQMALVEGLDRLRATLGFTGNGVPVLHVSKPSPTEVLA